METANPRNLSALSILRMMCLHGLCPLFTYFVTTNGHTPYASAEGATMPVMSIILYSLPIPHEAHGSTERVHVWDAALRADAHAKGEVRCDC